MPTVPAEAAVKFHIAVMGLQKVREKDRLARKTRLILSVFFINQKVLALKEFEKLKSHFETSPVKVSKTDVVAIDKWNASWEKIHHETFVDLQKIIVQAEGESMSKGWEQAQKMTDAGNFWDVSNPRAVKWFKENGGSLKYIKGIQDTTRDQLGTLITKALDEGWSYTETAKEMSGTFEEFGRDRAQRIAVHETGNAYEQGNRMFADSLMDDGVEMEKMWQRSNDERDCEDCIANEEEGWIPIGETHQSGDQQPLAHNGCRCYEIYREIPIRGG